jgi:Early Flowering 4 domain
MSFDSLVDCQGRPLTQIWPAVKQFQEVQDVLDRNRVLIAEINHNHQLGTHVALERNVPMLRELNGNVAKAVQLYKEAADSFVVGVMGQEHNGAGTAQPNGQEQQHAVQPQQLLSPPMQPRQPQPQSQLHAMPLQQQHQQQQQPVRISQELQEQVLRPEGAHPGAHQAPSSGPPSQLHPAQPGGPGPTAMQH